MVLYGRRSAKSRMEKVEKMKNKTLLILLALITAFGLLLRLMDYDKIPPPDEAFDEVFYAWGGASWIAEGIPKSWSWFEDYKNYTYINQYGINWRIVWPVIEKPPIYFLLSGLTVLASGYTNYFQVPHTIIRILPLILSVFTIYLTGFLASKIFNKPIGLISALIYVTVPTIVLANRMSLTENLITPLMLLSTVFLIKENKNKNRYKFTLIIALLSFLSLLTKQVGIVIALSAGLIYFMQKDWRKIYIIFAAALIAAGMYLTIATYYDLGLFFKLQQQWRIAHTLSSLPEVAGNIFRFPTIGQKNHPFVDGAMLLGYIFLFSSFLWLKLDSKKDFPLKVFLIFPFLYLLLLTIGESGAGPFTFFGWYLFPLFPFLAIVLAKFLWNFYKKPQLLSLILLNIIIGSSIIRFIFITVPRQYQYLWQYAFIMFFLLSLGVLHRQRRVQQFFLIGSFAIFILVNVYTVFNMREIYEYSIKGLDFSLFAK